MKCNIFYQGITIQTMDTNIVYIRYFKLKIKHETKSEGYG